MVGCQRAWELGGCEFYGPSSTPSLKPSGFIEDLGSHTYREYRQEEGAQSVWGCVAPEARGGLQVPSVLVGGCHPDPTGQAQALSTNSARSDW